MPSKVPAPSSRSESRGSPDHEIHPGERARRTGCRGRVQRAVPAVPPSRRGIRRTAGRGQRRGRRRLAEQPLPGSPSRLPRAQLRVLTRRGLARLDLDRAVPRPRRAGGLLRSRRRRPRSRARHRSRHPSHVGTFRRVEPPVDGDDRHGRLLRQPLPDAVHRVRLEALRSRPPRIERLRGPLSPHRQLAGRRRRRCRPTRGRDRHRRQRSAGRSGGRATRAAPHGLPTITGDGDPDAPTASRPRRASGGESRLSRGLSPTEHLAEQLRRHPTARAERARRVRRRAHCVVRRSLAEGRVPLLGRHVQRHPHR